MPKKTKFVPSEDEVRHDILSYLYDAYKNPRGMDSHKLKISKIRSDMKKKGIEGKHVIRNLNYLIETGWAIEEVKESKFFTGKMSVPTEQKTYRISKDGIDHFEEPSKFQKSDKLTGINITNVQGVVAIGNDNYIRNEFAELFKSLDELDREIRMTNELSDEEKVSYQAEINTIQSQLRKPKPDNNILKASWGVLKGLTTISSIAGSVEKILPIIQKLIGI